MRSAGKQLPASNGTRCFLCGTDSLRAFDVRNEGIGHLNASIGPLVVFKNRDQRATDGQTRAVEGVTELGLFTLCGPEANLRSPRLEIPAVGAGADFAINVLAGQPDLYVVCLCR